MGRKDKHKLGQTRNNPVFKVATGKVAKQKGKAKEVTTKLRNISSKKGNREAVEHCDGQLKALQGKSVSMIGKEKKGVGNEKIAPPEILAAGAGTKAKVDDLADAMDSMSSKPI